jgi:hypothetical protein
MENENYNPSQERKPACGERNEHKPPHYTQRIKQLATIDSADYAGMHRSLIHFASVRVRDPAARNNRSHGSQHHC